MGWLSRGQDTPFHLLTGWLSGTNLALALFNLIPGFPLDRGRIFRSALWSWTGNLRRATRIASLVGRLVGFAFIFWSLWQIFSGYWANGLWLLMIGWFLDTAAAQSYRQLVVQQALAGRHVQEAMIECPPVPRQLTLDAVVDRMVLPIPKLRWDSHPPSARNLRVPPWPWFSGRRSFPVLEEGRLTLGRISAVPRDEWRLTRAEEAMIPRSELRTVSPADDLATVFRSTATGDLDQLPVVEDDRFLGMVTRESMERFLRLRANGDAQHPKAA